MRRPLIIAALTLLSWPVSAHQAPSGWMYPPDCCGGKDCAQTEDVEITGAGYHIKGTHLLVGFHDPRIRPSPDSHFHACMPPSKSTVYCLFVPTMG